MLECCVGYLVECAGGHLVEYLGEVALEVAVCVTSRRYGVKYALPLRHKLLALLVYYSREVADIPLERLLVATLCDNILCRLLEKFAVERSYCSANIPTLSVAYALLGQLLQPLAQLVVRSDTLDERLDTLCEYGCGIKLCGKV